MNLPWVQLRTVVMVLVLVFFFRIILASPDEVTEEVTYEANNKLNQELEPFDHFFFGYLPLMPTFTVHSLLTSFMAQECFIQEEETLKIFSFSGFPPGFRNASDAALLATYIKQMSPFCWIPFGPRLTGPILERIAKEVTRKDLDDDHQHWKREILVPLWTEPFTRRWNAASVPVRKEADHYSVMWKHLMRYLVSGWRKYKKDQNDQISINRAFTVMTNEAALRWTVFEKIKQRFERDALDKELFQPALVDYQNSLTDQAMLLSYTLQLAIHHNLLNETGNKLLQAEFAALWVDPKRVSPEVDKFKVFLDKLDLIEGHLDNQALVEFKFKFKDLDLELQVNQKIPGLDYFKLLEPTDKDLFCAIFKGYVHWNQSVYNSAKLVQSGVFKWAHVTQFLASYWYMFKAKVVVAKPVASSPEVVVASSKGSGSGGPPFDPTPTESSKPLEPYKPKNDDSQRWTPTGLYPAPPQPAGPSKDATQKPPASGADVDNLQINSVTTDLPKVAEKGCWNKTQTCWNSLPWWEKGLAGALTLASVLSAFWLTTTAGDTASKGLTIFNSFDGSATTSTMFSSWMSIIIGVAFSMLLVTLGAAWWWWSSGSQAKESKRTKKAVKEESMMMMTDETAEPKGSKKQQKTLKMTSQQQLSLAVSSAASTLSASSLSSAASPVMTSQLSKLETSKLSSAGSSAAPSTLSARSSSPLQRMTTTTSIQSDAKTTSKISLPSSLQQQSKIKASKVKKKVNYKSALF